MARPLDPSKFPAILSGSRLTWAFKGNFMLPMVKLLAVDDTPSSLELLSESLRQEGLAFFTSTDPVGGRELVYREHPHVVLLGLVLPEMGGLQMVERVVAVDPEVGV